METLTTIAAWVGACGTLTTIAHVVWQVRIRRLYELPRLIVSAVQKDSRTFSSRMSEQSVMSDVSPSAPTRDSTVDVLSLVLAVSNPSALQNHVTEVTVESPSGLRSMPSRALLYPATIRIGELLGIDRGEISWCWKNPVEPWSLPTTIPPRHQIVGSITLVGAQGSLAHGRIKVRVLVRDACGNSYRMKATVRHERPLPPQSAEDALFPPDR